MLDHLLGLSTRFIGAIIMTHGDDQGLVLPPRLAPIQVVIVPIFRKDEEQEAVMAAVEKVRAELANFRVKVDDRMEVTPGFKFNEWELRGVPLRIEIGPKDVAKNSVALARRDIPGRDGKSFVSQDGIGDTVREMLDTIQANLLAKATKFRDENIFEPKDYNEFKEIIEKAAGAMSGGSPAWRMKPRSKKTLKPPSAASPWISPKEKVNASTVVKRQPKKPILPEHTKSNYFSSGRAIHGPRGC